MNHPILAGNIWRPAQNAAAARAPTSRITTRIDHAGYQHAPKLAGTKWHVRFRVLLSDLGIWTRKDPAGYRDGMNLYQYVRGRPLVGVDPMGLLTVIGTGGGGGCVTDLGCPGGGDIITHRVRGRNCDLDVSNARCASICQTTGNLGLMGCHGDTPWCCVCTGNISGHFPENWNIAGIVECIDVHETKHMEQGCPIPPDGSQEYACQEWKAMIAEIKCLEKKYSRCTQGRPGDRCRQICRDWIDKVWERLNEYRDKCLTVAATD